MGKKTARIDGKLTADGTGGLYLSKIVNGLLADFDAFREVFDARSVTMSNLGDILPSRQLVDRLGTGVLFEEYGKSALNAIAKKHPRGLFGLAANVWNRIVVKGWNPVDPQRFAQYFQATDPSLHLAISELIGAEVIRDIYYVKGWKGAKKQANLVVEMLVAWVYRSDLQLGDITFIDPVRPIPRKLRRFADQTHKGFGLLPTLMESLQRKAEELHCEQLTLTTARRDQVGLFARYGFRVEDSTIGRAGMELGYGIPMERDVAAATREQ